VVDTSPESVVTVLAADRHPLTLLGLTQTIQRSPELLLVATAADGSTAMALIEAERPQIALIDVRLDQRDGRDIARSVRARQLNTRILLLAEIHTGELVLQCLTAGASGFLSKRASTEAVRDAIIQIARGHAVLPDDVGPDVARVLRERGEAHAFTPTPGELEILTHVSQGETAAVIAQSLHISVPTVKSHTQNLYLKLGVNDRAAAVAVAIRRGLIP
jgi:two-component system nitrate/nitrite response regulator NarL